MPLVSRYLLFNKPFHVLCQFSRQGEKKTLADFIPVPAVYPAGRLDFDSEGLVLLTNDGALQHSLTHPLFAHPRTYWVQVEGTVTPQAIAQLKRGIVIDAKPTLPCEAAAIAEPLLPVRDPPVRFRKNIPTSWLKLILREGRNRQVRRMTATAGFPTLRLVRAAIGNLHIDGLLPGAWRDLTPAEARFISHNRQITPNPNI
jgi:23S rRNA pseudouridine2457 synthase